MAYWFAGFFARPAIPKPDDLRADALWREISQPFIGVGVRLPHLQGKCPSASEVATLADALGLGAADCWLYLTYTCWGGQIDSVYGLGSRGGVAFGPVEESARDTVEPAFIGLMSQLGVSNQDARQFAPFERGYWMEEKRCDPPDPDSVHDSQSFLVFARALAADRRASIRAEHDLPSSPSGPDTRGWENVSIERFLEGAISWAEDTEMGVSQGLPVEPSWKAFAAFLYSGKTYE